MTHGVHYKLYDYGKVGIVFFKTLYRLPLPKLLWLKIGCPRSWCNDGESLFNLQSVLKLYSLCITILLKEICVLF